MKGLAIRNTYVKYESPSPYNQKLTPRLKFLKRSNSKVKSQKVKVMISNERSCQKEYTCEI
jgi:hypothetical protein